MQDRLSLFRSHLAARELSAALITDEKNIGYLCRYRFDDGCLLITRENAYIITDFRYKEEAEKLIKAGERELIGVGKNMNSNEKRKIES